MPNKKQQELLQHYRAAICRLSQCLPNCRFLGHSCPSVSKLIMLHMVSSSFCLWLPILFAFFSLSLLWPFIIRLHASTYCPPLCNLLFLHGMLVIRLHTPLMTHLCNFLLSVLWLLLVRLLSSALRSSISISLLFLLLLWGSKSTSIPCSVYLCRFG